MPRRDFALDANGDRAIVNGDWSFVADRPAVGQGIKVRLQMFLGEYWLDQSVGTPWLQRVLIRNPSGITVRETMRAQVLATPDVVACTAVSLEVDAQRRAAARLTFSDVYGDASQTITATVP